MIDHDMVSNKQHLCVFVFVWGYVCASCGPDQEPGHWWQHSPCSQKDRQEQEMVPFSPVIVLIVAIVVVAVITGIIVLIFSMSLC